jgi:hypothetical protein
MFLVFIAVACFQRCELASFGKSKTARLSLCFLQLAFSVLNFSGAYQTTSHKSDALLFLAQEICPGKEL